MYVVMYFFFYNMSLGDVINEMYSNQQNKMQYSNQPSPIHYLNPNPPYYITKGNKGRRVLPYYVSTRAWIVVYLSRYILNIHV